MCIDCEARRNLIRAAWLRANLGEVVVQAAKGAAEAIGLKEKTGELELKWKAPKRKTAKQDPGAAG